MEEKMTNIGGRLHDVSVKHTVAGANEIMDDNLEKKQDVINAEQQTINQESNTRFDEHEEHLGEHDTEIADRYTKEEVNNIVSRTPETDVIVLDSISGISVVGNVYPTTAESWVRGSINSAGEDKEDQWRFRTGFIESREGCYLEVRLLTPILYDAIDIEFYDINQAHLGTTDWQTSGTYTTPPGTKYIRFVIRVPQSNTNSSAEGAAAAGECIMSINTGLDTIPVEDRPNNLFRVPGPTNKTYSEWAWDGTKWVMLANKDYGIDSEPIIGSDNTIKSDTVARLLTGLTEGIIHHAYIDTNTKQIKPHKDYYISPLIPVEGSTQYEYRCGIQAQESGLFVCLLEYDANMEMITWQSNSEAGGGKTFVSEPDAKYFRATFYVGAGSTGNYIKPTNSTQKYLWRSPIDMDRLYNNNKLEYYADKEIVEGHYLDAAGNFVPDDNFFVTPFIPLPDGLSTLGWSTGYYTSVAGDNKHFLLFYDRSKNFIGGSYWRNNAELKEIPIESGYVYVRFSVHKDYVTKSFIYNDKKKIIYSPTNITESMRASLMEGLVDGHYLTVLDPQSDRRSDRLVADSNWMVSPFVEISPEQRYIFWFAGVVLPAGQNLMQLGFFDANKNPIAEEFWSNGYACTRAYIPSNARYLRVSIPKDAHKDSYIIDSFGNLVYSYDGDINRPYVDKQGVIYGYRLHANTARGNVENLVRDDNWAVSPVIAINPSHVGENYKYSVDFGVRHGGVAEKTTILIELDGDYMRADNWGNGVNPREIYLTRDTLFVRFGIYLGEGTTASHGTITDLTDGTILWKYMPASGSGGGTVDETTILGANPRNIVKPYFEGAVRREINTANGMPEGRKNLVLLHYSDIHNDINNLNRIVEFQNEYQSYIDDVLLTGDIAEGSWPDYNETAFSNAIVRRHLKVIGNHDVYNYNGAAPSGTPTSDPTYWANEAQAYARYMAGIENWGVAYQQDKCYWYKDYTTEGIRLICLDFMLWNSAQETWLNNTLASAKSAGLAVVCTVHCPIQATVGKKDIITPMQGATCAFNTPTDTSSGGEDALRTSHLKAMADCVQEFIDRGGEFVCWLTGHTHTDYCGIVAEYPQQIEIVVGVAKLTESWSDITRIAGEKSQDLFNIVSIDAQTKMIRVFRIGANVNRFMQKRESMCIDWANRRIVYSS